MVIYFVSYHDARKSHKALYDVWCVSLYCIMLYQAYDKKCIYNQLIWYYCASYWGVASAI